MIKTLRRQFWFVTSFFSKYYKQVIGGIFFAIVLAVGISFVSRFFPQGKKNYYYAIVGQYNSNQLPAIISQYLSAGLTNFDPKQQVIPQMAESWWLENDNKTYVFKLKPDLSWSNKEKLDLEDIQLNIPNVQTEITKPDIIKFHLPAKFSPFPSILSFPVTSKKNQIVSPYQIKIKQKSSGIISEVILESSIERKTFKIYPSGSQSLTAYKLGQVDAIIGLNQYFQTDTDKEFSSYGKITQSPNHKQVVQLIFNQQDPLLKSKSLRQAFAYAIADKTFGFTRALTTINPESWAYNPLVKTYDFDPIKAADLFKTNTPAGQKLEIELSTLPELLPIAENIKTQLEQFGLILHTKVVSSSPDSFQIFLSTFSIPSDPDQYIYWHSTQTGNIGKQSDEKLDKSLEEGRTVFENKERKKIYAEFQRVFAEELPALPLYHPNILNLARNQHYSDIINRDFAP